MTNLELFYFTGKCLTLDEHPGFREEVIEKIADDSFDWEKFAALCSSHLILPVIYLKFQSHHILEFLPDEVLEFLKEIYDLNRTRNTQILKQLQEVTGILNKGNIYPVYLKGAGHLLDGLYADIGERMMGDIDLLVPEKDFLLSARLLENEGYAMAGPCYMEIEKLKHYPGLLKPGAPAHLEIHRLPVAEAYQSWFNPEIIDRDKKTGSSLNGCYVLSDQHNIIHNFIHSQLDHEGNIYGIVSFRDLYDLYLLSKRFPAEQTLPEIKSKRKAISYFVFAGKAFGLPGKFYPTGNFSSWLFSKKHDLNQSSKAFYLTYRTILYIKNRVLIGVTRQIIQAFYSKKMRQSVINRISDPHYVRESLKTYKDFFSRNK
jgi:hypothetical protein